MSLSKLNSFSRLGRPNGLVFVRFSGNDAIKSVLGAPRIIDPFADPQRIRSAPIVPINFGNVFAQVKLPIVEKKTEFTHATPVIEEPPVVKAEEPVKLEIRDSKPIITENVEKIENKEVKVSAATAIDELTSLKESLHKLEEASAKATSSAGGSGSGDDQGPSSQEEIEKRRKRMERNTRIGGMVVGSGSIIGFIAFCVYYGRAKRDENGNVIQDEFTGSIFAPFYRILNSFKLWRDYVVEPAREQLLPDPLPAPYLQPKYTIVIEMKNVLVHPDWTYKTGYRFAKRPALDYFLDVVGYPNFEVVIYSSESMMTGAPVVDSFDPKQRIMYKLFRDCTKYMNGHHVKDLSKLNRDLSKVIYIDFDVKSGQLNPENMLRVPEWKGNMDDTSLVDLAELLKTIHLSDTEDVRPMIQYYSQYDDPPKEFRRRAIYLAEQEAQKKSNPAEQSTINRYTGRLFGFRRHASA